MPEPWKRKEVIGDCTLYLGNCREIMPELGKVDAVVTDPPYRIDLNTDSSRFSGGNCAGVARRRSRGMELRSRGVANGKPVIGDKSPFDPSFLKEYGQEQIIWGLNNYPEKLGRGTSLVWIKRNDKAFGSFLSDAEIAWFSKGHGVYCRRDLSMKAIERHRVHPTQKPVALMEWCLGFLPNAQTILDPFAGSGTTLVACAKLGRKGIGIELDESYFDIACRRVEEAYRQPDMFVERPAKAHQEALSFDGDVDA